jgi:hypothetical protein
MDVYRKYDTDEAREFWDDLEAWVNGSSRKFKADADKVVDAVAPLEGNSEAKIAIVDAEATR